MLKSNASVRWWRKCSSVSKTEFYHARLTEEQVLLGICKFETCFILMQSMNLDLFLLITLNFSMNCLLANQERSEGGGGGLDAVQVRWRNAKGEEKVRPT
jgi:hypothetical protein